MISDVYKQEEDPDAVIITQVNRASFQIDNYMRHSLDPQFSQEQLSIELQRLHPSVQALIDTELHTVPLEKFKEQIDTDFAHGLTSQERANRLTAQGLNKLTEQKPLPGIVRWLMTQADLFAILLWIASIVSFVMFGVTGEDHNLYLGCCFAFVNIFSGSLTFCQERSSTNLMNGFKHMIPEKCQIISDGIQKEVDATSLVLGDVVILQAGMKTPADLRCIKVNQLKIDLSSFNGETEPAARRIENSEMNILRADNVCFFTSNVVNGDGIGVVIATGDRTVIGRQAQTVIQAKQPPTPMQKEIARFVKFISIIAIAAGILFLILQLIFKIKFVDALIFAIGICVATVPEGLSLTITVALTLSAKRLAKHNVMVKELNQVETLGSVQNILSDKTGTITMNQMTVSHTYSDGKIAKHHIDHARQEFDFAPDSLNNKFMNILILNSRTEIDETDKETSLLKKKLNGDASEQGIYRFSYFWIKDNVEQFKNSDHPIQEYRQQYPKKFEIPFSSVYKFQFSVHQMDDKTDLFALKGAPEKILNVCDQMLIDGKVVNMGEPEKDEVMKGYQEIASYGERVLGLGYLEREPQSTYDYSPSDVASMKFIFLGLVSLVDPPKDKVAYAISQCQSAHVGVTMVTGDHYLTATAISKEIGLLSESVDYFVDEKAFEQSRNGTVEQEEIKVAKEVSIEEQNENDKVEKGIVHKRLNKEQQAIERIKEMPAQDKQFVPAAHSSGAVMSGNVLERLTDQQLQYFLYCYPQIVFARTTPEQKLQITQAYQSLGHIVAVSGDGLNDAPALKAADIGVAMASGSEVARDAGNVILLDNDFSTIVLGVEQGRLIFENFKKAMAYTLTSTVSQVMPFLLFVVCGFPNALSSMLILLIDVVTDIWPAFALAYEPPEQFRGRWSKKSNSGKHQSHGFEMELMKRPPRDQFKDRILDGQLLGFSVGQIGCYQALTMLLMFMLTERHYISKYFGLECSGFKWSIFSNMHHKDYVDYTLTNLLSDKQACFAAKSLSFPKKVKKFEDFPDYIFKVGQTAAFLSVVLSQFFDAITSRTRLTSLFMQGLFSNKEMILGVAAQIGLASLIIYVPSFNTVFSTRQLDGTIWGYAIPFAVIILIYDEFRKLGLRMSGVKGKFYKAMKW